MGAQDFDFAPNFFSKMGVFRKTLKMREWKHRKVHEYGLEFRGYE